MKELAKEYICITQDTDKCGEGQGRGVRVRNRGVIGGENGEVCSSVKNKNKGKRMNNVKKIENNAKINKCDLAWEDTVEIRPIDDIKYVKSC